MEKKKKFILQQTKFKILIIKNNEDNQNEILRRWRDIARECDYKGKWLGQNWMTWRKLFSATI